MWYPVSNYVVKNVCGGSKKYGYYYGLSKKPDNNNSFSFFDSGGNKRFYIDPWISRSIFLITVYVFPKDHVDPVHKELNGPDVTMWTLHFDITCNYCL